MRPARLLHIDPCARRFSDARVAELPATLRPGDLLVVNDASTVPASLTATVRGAAVEIRLAGEQAPGEHRAVVFGAGDWRTPTERRPAPPRLAPGERLVFGDDLAAEVVEVAALSPRLVRLRFEPGATPLIARLFAHGRPVQYSHVAAPYALWDVQTSYGARPWAVEPPSAGFALAPGTLLELRRRGVRLAWLTHAAGLSATGDPAIDAALPLPERYEIPEETVAAVAETRRAGGRVVAVGTTVVRALEGARLAAGELVAGAGVTDLAIGPDFRPAIIDGLLTGLHEEGSSHLRLLAAFVAPPLLGAAYAHALAAGYRAHERGDSSLVLCA
jgi:S-adenosylmethionine:tRNA ribosyltransferase-isomerase